mmetsp:Transcript_1502/g.1917  ORF Transcript_1502/g.1917 Transcript_1502/m.1917 type:complete len:201 (+) Transcript_1502:101-703(+)|eukprot:CAMPEP_0172516996 /NCGR_PEP_ID=MMETSP1066-20121228/280893_1 /TAXON_ID=671091 /ORGANISM="Coscinodiscus wailesii, Strain CCMP2513" /LENGTH=200 /DNA_ID=CAMNT_0013298733 /DNA_START=77 /DNA_END=679 /DNA_ORIENTATION=-
MIFPKAMALAPILLLLLLNTIDTCRAFGIAKINPTWQARPTLSSTSGTPNTRTKFTFLQMSDSGDGGGGGDMSRQRKTKKGISTIVMDKVEQKQEEDKKDEQEWRVVLHNDEVHTFEYVVMSLVKVIGTIDRKKAWDICVLTHGNGKATIVKAWKDQAQKYCLGLQRQGLTASIAPDSNFEGGGDGGGGGGGGDDGPGTE